MNEGLGIGGHHSPNARTVEWLTPPWLLKHLGDFDLDPCAPLKRPWDTATVHFSKDVDGLSVPWHGFVWLNPPYGRETGTWLERLAHHDNGIALTFARTETFAWHQFVWPCATSIVFLRGRLNFYHPDGTESKKNAGGPSALIGYGLEATKRLGRTACVLDGKFVRLRP